MGALFKPERTTGDVRARWGRRLARLGIDLEVIETGHPWAATWIGGPFPAVFVRPGATAADQNAAIERAIGVIAASQGKPASRGAVRENLRTMQEMQRAALEAGFIAPGHH